MKIQEMSNEALLKRKKTTEVVTATLAGLLTVLLIAALFLCFNKQSSIGLPLLMIPLALSSVLYININVLPNYPNPFDESTYVVLKNDGDAHYNNAYLTIRKADGTVLERRKIQIRSGINEYIFSYKNEGKIETFYYTFEVDGRAMGTNRMMTRY